MDILFTEKVDERIAVYDTYTRMILRGWNEMTFNTAFLRKNGAN